MMDRLIRRAASLVVAVLAILSLRLAGGAGDVQPAQAPASGPPGRFTFALYGDSRAGDNCSDNADHLHLVGRIVDDNPALVLHLGDMVTGYKATTNWIQRGGCADAASNGSLKEIIAPLMAPAPEGLPTRYFPVLGNHDDNWNDGWYPDASKNGVCDLFGATTIRALVPNHTAQSYFRDKTGRNYPIRSDDDFYRRLCSTSNATRDVFPAFFYYSFDYRGSHFVVMRINSDYYDVRAGNGPCTAASENNYDTCYNVHQLHWLQADLARAKANPNTKHIFAFLHAPVFTSGDDHPASSSWPSLSKEFSKAKADVVFAGHDHVYERTVPIYATIDNPDGVRDDERGTVYVITGGGGSPLTGFLPKPAWFDVVREATKHYVRVTVDADQVSVEAIAIDGKRLDRFAVRQQLNRTSPPRKAFHTRYKRPHTGRADIGHRKR